MDWKKVHKLFAIRLSRKEIEKLLLLPLSTAAKDIATRESGYICESLIFFSVIVRNYYDRLRSFKIVSLFF